MLTDGAAIVGVAFLTDRKFSFGWSLLLLAALGVGLVACSTRFRLARASQMALAGLIALNLFACTVMLVQVRPMSTPLIVLVLVASMSLLGDWVIPLHGRLRESPESLRTVRLALVGLRPQPS